MSSLFVRATACPTPVETSAVWCHMIVPCCTGFSNAQSQILGDILASLERHRRLSEAVGGQQQEGRQQEAGVWPGSRPASPGKPIHRSRLILSFSVIFVSTIASPPSTSELFTARNRAAKRPSLLGRLAKTEPFNTALNLITRPFIASRSPRDPPVERPACRQEVGPQGFLPFAAWS